MENIFAHRLKSARLQAGITQAALAEAVGISKQAVSQYEHGKKKPDSQTLIAIARYFDRSAGYFMRPFRTRLEQVDFRKRAKLKGKALESIKAHILDRLEPYLELEQILNIDPHFENPLADLVVTTEEQAENAALRLQEKWRLGLNPISNISEMLEDRGVKVVMVKVDKQFDGLSTLVDGKIPVIVINATLDTLRKRFTLLHELGHLLLPIPETASHKVCERLCNRFAGAVLLPKSTLQEEVGQNRRDINLQEMIAIKEYYGISLAAIMYWGKQLGVFTPGLANRFWKMRNANPKLRTEEGYGNYQGEERAYRFDQLLSKALALDLISFSKAAQLAGTDLQTLRAKHQLI